MEITGAVPRQFKGFGVPRHLSQLSTALRAWKKNPSSTEGCTQMGWECPGSCWANWWDVQSKKGAEVGTCRKIKGDMPAPPGGCLCNNESWGKGKCPWRKPSTSSQWKLSCQQILQASTRSRLNLRKDTDPPLTHKMMSASPYVSILSTTPEKSMPRKELGKGRTQSQASACTFSTSSCHGPS